MNSTLPHNYRTYKSKISWTWYYLIALYIIHLTQGLFYPQGSIIGQLSILLILMVGIIDLLRSIFMPQKMPSGLKWILLLLTVLLIYYYISPKIIHTSGRLATVETYNQLKEIISFYIPIYIGFQIGLHKHVSEKQWLIVSFLILVLAILCFIKTEIYYLKLGNLKEITNNAAYIFIMIIPFLPLIVKKYKIATLVLLTVIFIYVMLGAKRGAILCMLILLLSLFKWYIGSKMSVNRFIIISVFAVAGVLGMQYFMTENNYLQQRYLQTLEGDTSGRDYYYEILWNAWLNADGMTQFFGRGSAQTLNLLGNYAHNDWLEFLTNNGILGVLLYLGVIISLFSFNSKFLPKSPTRCSFNLVILMWVIQSIFSMGMGITTGITMMLIGTQMGNYYLNRKIWRRTLKFKNQPHLVKRTVPVMN